MNDFLTKVFKKVRPDFLILSVLLLISGFAHTQNMFEYPYIENDEATYTARAYNYYQSGELDVYTYRYDHAPLGWLTLGPPLHVADMLGFDSDLVYSARTLMLILHLMSSVLLYYVAKRMTGNRIAGVVAVLVFALSPLGIYFQRRVLLDNIMTFWILASLFSALNPKRRLRDFQFSGLFFAFSILVKLNAVFVGPALLYLVFKRSQKENRILAVTQWLMISGFTLSLFFIYSMIKGEFLPAPIDPDTGLPTRVSLIDTFRLQLGRGQQIPFYNESSDFYQAAKLWLTRDWVTVTAGLGATLMLGIISFFDKHNRTMHIAASGLVATLTFFLIRGGIVLDLYITPFIPLLALNIGLVASWGFSKLNHKSTKLIAGSVLAVIIILAYGFTTPKEIYKYNETRNQISAINWVEENIEPGSIIVTDNYAFPSLAQNKDYPSVYYFFTAEYDFEIRNRYEDDWRNFDYMILSHEVLKQIKAGQIPRMKQILDHSELVADFTDNSTSFIDFDKYISTNGDWARVYKVKDRVDILGQDSWDYFRADHIISYGQVIDVTNDDLTTSTGQTEAMLRATQEDDRATFDGIRAWTRDHLQFRQDDKLLSWQWTKDANGEYSLGDTNNVCDADQTHALALIEATRKWGFNDYYDDANIILDDFWNKCVVQVGDKLLVQSSVDGSQTPFLINPGYFNPAMYRTFAEFDSTHNWQKLIDDGYLFADDLLAFYGTLPDWTQASADGSIFSAVPIVGAGGNSFGNDSANGTFRLINDASKYGDFRGFTLVGKLYEDIEGYDEFYNTFGSGAFLVSAQQLLRPDGVDLQQSYSDQVFSPYDPESGLFGDGDDFASQVWFWKWTEAQDHLLTSEIEIL